MTAQYGPHRWSAGDDRDHAALRGNRFEVEDLTGARFLDCDLSGVKIIDSWLVDVDVSGYVDGLVINGVEVGGYVEAELDRRHPERVQLRQIRDADGFRAMGDTMVQLWADHIDAARAVGDAALTEQVDGEWSLIQTLQHLIFITDSWASRTILDEPMPYHRIGLTQTAYPQVEATALGIDLTARPSWAEVAQVRADRQVVVRAILADLTDADLGRACTRTPAPGYPEETRAVADCLAVVLEEECEHLRFARRDLAVITAR